MLNLISLLSTSNFVGGGSFVLSTFERSKVAGAKELWAGSSVMAGETELLSASQIVASGSTLACVLGWL